MNLENRVRKLEQASQEPPEEDRRDERFRELCRQKAVELQARMAGEERKS